MIDNSSVDRLTVPLLDTDNLENSSNMNTEEERTIAGSTVNRSERTTTTTLTAHPILSFLTMPLRIMFFILMYFKQNIEASTREEAGNKKFLKSIPQEQKALKSDMNHVKRDQKSIGRNIDNLTLRVQALEEKRRKREEALKKFAGNRDEEKKDIMYG